MRFHTNKLTEDRVRQMLAQEQVLDRIASHVDFKILATHGSRTHKRAIEMQLEAGMRDRGRRAGNSGSYGAMRPEYDGYAATYDEWGWLIARMFEADPEMVAGSVKHPQYADREDFDEKTAWTYNPLRLLQRLDQGVDPFPFIWGKGARTKRGYLEGRAGAGRHRERHGGWGVIVERPRTVAEVMEFARLQPTLA